MELKNISKSFGKNQVLFDVNFQLQAGEIHAIIGENGAGKSTLMNIVDGLIQKDSGEILIGGKRVEINTPLEAQKHGICFVHQEIALCQDVSVAQNIFMSEINAEKRPTVNYKNLSKKAKDILDTLVQGTINPSKLVGNLTISNQQVVEIAKALSAECKVLILDEPTAALSEAETEALYRIMHKLTERKIGIIYISHRMSEIFEHCDRITVLRDGCMVSSYGIKDAKIQQLVNDMAGREVSTIYPKKAEKLNYSQENILLRVKNLTDENKRFENINFDLYKGEMLGFSGLVGSGRSEIMQGITGLRRLKTGEVWYKNINYAGMSTKKIFNDGMLYMSEDRKQSGLFLEMSITHNCSAINLEEITNKGLINAQKEKERAIRLKEQMNVKASSVNQHVLDLSGGNQQKVLIAKLLAKNPDILILDEPTRGIDVAAKAEIHQLLRKLISQGIGVIIVSSELNEVIGMCDRVMIVNEGSIVGEVSGEEINSNNIIYFSSGAFKVEESNKEDNVNEHKN